MDHSTRADGSGEESWDESPSSSDLRCVSIHADAAIFFFSLFRLLTSRPRSDAEVALGNMVRRVLYIIREEYSEESQSAKSAELTHTQKSLQTLVTRSLDKSADYKEVRHNLKSSVIEAIGELRLELENRFAYIGDALVVSTLLTVLSLHQPARHHTACTRHDPCQRNHSRVRPLLHRCGFLRDGLVGLEY